MARAAHEGARDVAEAGVVTARRRLRVADDHLVSRRGMRGPLTSTDRYEVVAEARDTATVVAATIERSPDVAVVDLQHPDGNGDVLAARLLAE